MDKSERSSFVEGCKSARDGIGGAVLSHAGCYAAPAIAGALGGTLSHGFMAAAMYVTSPLIAVGATRGIDYLRERKTSAGKLLTSAGVSLAAIFAINQYSAHHDTENHKYGQYESVEEMLKNAPICGQSRILSGK
ncbi:MAG: hypothetical protein CMH28_06285 [Micavibrio sp.]|nr:hypothetical protein [Micavibrio sp.]